MNTPKTPRALRPAPLIDREWDDDYADSYDSPNAERALLWRELSRRPSTGAASFSTADLQGYGSV